MYITPEDVLRSCCLSLSLRTVIVCWTSHLTPSSACTSSTFTPSSYSYDTETPSRSSKWCLPLDVCINKHSFRLIYVSCWSWTSLFPLVLSLSLSLHSMTLHLYIALSLQAAYNTMSDSFLNDSLLWISLMTHSTKATLSSISQWLWLLMRELPRLLAARNEHLAVLSDAFDLQQLSLCFIHSGSRKILCICETKCPKNIPKSSLSLRRGSNKTTANTSQVWDAHTHAFTRLRTRRCAGEWCVMLFCCRRRPGRQSVQHMHSDHGHRGPGAEQSALDSWWKHVKNDKLSPHTSFTTHCWKWSACLAFLLFFITNI